MCDLGEVLHGLRINSYHEAADLIEQLQQRIAELEQALVDDSLAKIMLEKMTTENEQLDIKLSGNIFHVFCQSFVRTFENAGAENYLTMEFHSDEIGDFTVTMQRSQGLTVYEKLKVVEQERDELAAAVERMKAQQSEVAARAVEKAITDSALQFGKDNTTASSVMIWAKEYANRLREKGDE